MGRGRGIGSSSVQVSRRSAKQPAVVSGTPYTSDELKLFAKQILAANHVKPGDVISLELTNPAQKAVVSAIADEAFSIGATYEIILPASDPGFEKQMDSLVEQDSMFINLQSYTPEPEEVSGNVFTSESYCSRYDEGGIRWNIAMWPTREWGEKVYPELDSDKAYRQLGQDFMKFMRVGTKESWGEHIKKLRTRSDRLNSLGVKTITMKSPGTNLSMNVFEDSRFLPVEWETKTGATNLVNLPSEEIFTTPDPSSVQGYFTSTKPFVVSDENETVEINGIRGEYENGVLVKIESLDSPEFNEYLESVFLDTDSGMNRIGELGLVDPENLIGSTGRIYYNNFIDENVSSHLGAGSFYPQSISEEGLAAGVKGNEAAEHLDFIVGSPDMDISILCADGETRDLIKDGRWQDI